MSKSYWALAVLYFLPGYVRSQSIVVFDTIYTPTDYVDGAQVGRMYMPALANGVGVVAVYGLQDSLGTMHCWGDSLAAHGYTVLSIDFPDPGSGAFFPKPIRALKTAIQFLRMNQQR